MSKKTKELESVRTLLLEASELFGALEEMVEAFSIHSGASMTGKRQRAIERAETVIKKVKGK